MWRQAFVEVGVPSRTAVLVYSELLKRALPGAESLGPVGVREGAA